MKAAIILTFTLFIIAGCGNKSNLKFSETKSVINPFKPQTETDEAYLALQKNLFSTQCIRCHDSKKAREENRVDLTKKKQILDNFDDIIYRMTDAFDLGIDNMPPEGDQISQEVVNQLKAWKEDQTFARLQKNIFETSCIKCHNPKNTKRMDLTSKVVIINKYDEILYRMTNAFEDNKKPMPPINKGERVSQKLIDELQAWKNTLGIN